MPLDPRTSGGTRVQVQKQHVSQRKEVTIKRSDLDWAASKGLIQGDQVGRLWQALLDRTSTNSGFDLAHLAYYVGASLVLLALGWFTVLITAQFEAPALVATSLTYIAGFTALGYHLYFRRDLRVPGGLMYTLAVSVTPLLVYGLLSLANGPARLTSSSEFILEFATCCAALIALNFVRFPFLTMPLFASLWFMSMTAAGLVRSGPFMGNEQIVVSMIFGGLISLVALIIDRRTNEDFAFWGYLFGVSSFWVAYSFLDKGQGGLFIYFLVNIVLMLTSVLLQRRIFLVTGGLGATGYLIYLSYDIFKDSFAFPIALTVIGVSVILMGILYHNNKAKVDGFILNLLPSALTRSLPHNRRS
ncbi:MAG: hypothetical protein K2X93_04045 [Candidatus Obscuribacterales bacterium]|nr:hypothetical protein [Candidatus Obscuribacterales bacterium]